MRPPPVLVAGAGVAGVGVARQLSGRGVPALVLEAGDGVGGTCAGFRLGGWRFDYGLHCFFTAMPSVLSYVHDVMGPHHRERPLRELLWYDGRWLPYPPLRNLAAYPAVAALSPERAPASGDCVEVVRAHLGDQLATAFVLPQLASYWGRIPAELPAPAARSGGLASRAEIEAGLHAPLDDPPSRTWWYPVAGGFGDYVSRLATGVRVRYRATVSRVDAGARRASTADGRSYDFDRLVSTLPLPELVDIVADLPDGYRHRARRLRYSSVTLVSLAVSAATPPGPWVYGFTAGVPWFRAVFPTELDPAASPPGTASVQTETYWQAPSPPPADLRDRVVTSLRDLRLIPADARLLRSDVRSLRYATTLADDDDRAFVNELADWLDRRGVTCVGRYGRWDNGRFDQTLRHSLDCADGLADDLVPAVDAR